MKKRILAYGILWVACWLGLSGPTSLSAQNGFANYISISNGKFMDGNNTFLPLCVNYLVDYFYDLDSTDYYISPHGNYSSQWGYPDNTNPVHIPGDGRFCFGEQDVYHPYEYLHERNSATLKLERDLHCIDSLGFNVVRLRPVTIWNNNTLHVPTDSYERYFALQDSLIAQCARHNLRVILVLEADTHAYLAFEQYCTYLDSVSRHYSTNKTVMAYVIYAEPSYKWGRAYAHDKLVVSNWSRKWYYIVKNNAPNQLVTYGLDGIENVLFWDPSALTCDFLSMHFYYNVPDVNVAQNAVHTYFKWMNHNVENVWMLGETGFSGTSEDSCHSRPSLIGTENDQSLYADYTMQKSLECACQGYSWWQYQEVMWASCLQNYFGFLTYYPDERLKPVASLFPSFSSRFYVENLCPKPSCYYNIPGYTHPNISGRVLDEDNNPVEDALVVGWSEHWKESYSTFTNAQGEYTLYTPQDTTIRLVWISQKGYTAISFNPREYQPAFLTLTQINHDGWMKNWTNSSFPEQDAIPVIESTTPMVVGNFYGDEAQELLLFNTSNHTAKMYSYQIHHWEEVWSGSIDGWYIRSTDQFSAGDFDGDGHDELLCVQSLRKPWAKTYSFAPQNPTNPWQNDWSNGGNGHIGSWAISSGDIILSGHFNDTSHCSLLCIRKQSNPQALCQAFASSAWSTVWSGSANIGGQWYISNVDQYYVGDFNGDGLDELLCTQVTNGDSDWMSLLHYGTSWSTLWSNYGISEGSGIYPYRGNFLVGNFDPDHADELLGVGSWATKFDFNTSDNWDWSWSTYQSARLSDWTVSTDWRSFFIKAISGVPDYLVTALKGRQFRMNAYSFNP